MTHTTNWLWQEQMFVWAAYLYYVDNNSHWRDMTYDAHVEWLHEHKADWTDYIKSRLPDDYNINDPEHHLITFGHALKWTEDDARNAIDWRNQVEAGTWAPAAEGVASKDETVYTTLTNEDVTPQEVIVTEATTEEVPTKRKRRTKAEIAAAKAAATALDQIAEDAEPAPAPIVEPPKKDLATLVEKYVQVRDRKKAIVEKAKEDAAKFDAVLNKIEAILLASFNELGTDNVKTPHGTAYKSTRTSATVADWDTAFGYIHENQLWNMLERRVSKVAIEEYKAEYGELPPGINWREEMVINIRRA